MSTTPHGPEGSGASAARRDLLLLFGLAVLMRVAMWVVGARLVPPSSDESITLLLARQIAGGHFPLLFMGQPYLFPIESYLSVPWAWLSPGGGQARLTALLLGLATTWFALKLLPTECGRRTRWLGGLLAVVPSFYVLMLQGFYALPGYAFLMFTCVALPVITMRTLQGNRPAGALLVGFLSGLSFSAHTLSLCASIPALLALLTTGRDVRTAGKRCVTAGTGLLLGLLSFLVARLTIPGAHEMATAALPWPDIVSRWWSIGPHGALPIAQGLRAVDFPIIEPHPAPFPGFEQGFAAFLFILLCATFLWRVQAQHQNIKQGQLLRWQTADFMLAILLLNFTLVAAAPRAHFDSSRYLLPAALALPLLVATLLGQHRQPLRLVGMAAGLALLLGQLPTVWMVTKAWRQPDFALRASVPELKAALEGLRSLQIDHVFASYGAAYRLNYESGGTVVASQRKNERFLGWPIPYLCAVTSSPRVAYVLTEAISYLKPSTFETQLMKAAISAHVMTSGAFRIYYDFDEPRRHTACRLPPQTIQASAPRPEIADRLSDGTMDNPWRISDACSHDAVALTWTNTLPLDHVLIHYGVIHDYPKTMDMLYRNHGEWLTLAHGMRVEPVPFSMEHGYPVYGQLTEFIDLHGEPADGLKFQVNQPQPGRDWNITEIEVYTQCANTPHVAL